MSKALRETNRGIATPHSPPANAEFIGEYVMWGGEQHPIYKELRPWQERSAVVEVLDREGNPVFHQDTHGRRTRKMTERRETIPESDPRAWREFIDVDLRNGNRKKVFNFRGDPEKERARKIAAEREAKWAKIMDELDPDQLLAAAAVATAPKRRAQTGQ